MYTALGLGMRPIDVAWQVLKEEVGLVETDNLTDALLSQNFYQPGPYGPNVKEFAQGIGSRVPTGDPRFSLTSDERHQKKRQDRFITGMQRRSPTMLSRYEIEQQMQG